MNATDEYDVNDEDFPINEATNPIGNTSKSFSSLLKMGKNKGGPLDQPDKPIRNPRPKLDFNRLLKGSRGLGYLAVCAKKSLKLSGKPGGEATDLSQISVYLQEWAKLVFPKMPLIEFLAKVEELCQSRLMKACVPEILSRLKELGDGVNLKDLESVQGEVMTKLETDEAEKALKSINHEFNLDADIAKSSYHADKAVIDFNLEEIFERHQVQNRRERVERSELIKSDEDETEEEEYEYCRDSREIFWNKGNDSESEYKPAVFSSEIDEEKEKTVKRRRGIALNFADDSETEPEQEIEPAVKSKKRSIGIIMESDDDDEDGGDEKTN